MRMVWKAAMLMAATPNWPIILSTWAWRIAM